MPPVHDSDEAVVVLPDTHVGAQRPGDPPDFAPYRNPWCGGLAVQGPLVAACEWGAGVDWRTPIGCLGPLGEATRHLAWRQRV